jgi:ribosomal-protein-alanine N-acetyltransferase
LEGLIRRAGIADLERLRPVARACFPDSWGDSALAGALHDRGARVWLALRDETPGAAAIGFVLARRIVELLEIDLLGVAPDFRRGGLAARLLARLLDVERGAGLAEARLELSTSNSPAAGLYASQGFVVVGRRPRYYPDGSDALLLSRSFV